MNTLGIPSVQPLGFLQGDYSAPSKQPFNAEALGVPEPKDPIKAQKLWKVAQAMEATFTKYMLDEMGKTTPGCESVPGNAIYADMFRQTMADKMAESPNGIGLAKQIYLSVDNMITRPNINQAGNTNYEYES